MSADGDIHRWLELLAQGDLSGSFDADGDPEQRRILELLAQVQDRWTSERHATLAQMVNDLNQNVELKVREREHLEDKVQLGRKLHDADHMAAVGRLAAGMSHEINNPLTIIMGNIGTILGLVADPEVVPASRRTELRQLLAELEQGADRIRRIVSDVRDFCQQGRADECSAVDLAAAMDSALRLVRHRLDRELPVFPRYEASHHGLAIRPHLQRVFFNLVLNAVEALATERSRSPRIEVSISSAGSDEVQVKIEDNGPGIPEGDLERIFDPFFTTKDVGAGTGLGLSVSHGLVRAMGGRLEVHSEVGVGTSFTVCLKKAAEQVIVIEGPSQEQGESAVNKILVIDDEPFILQLLTRMLKKHEVTSVTSGVSALDLLQRESDFGVVLCDLMMPELTGMQLYDRVKALDPQLAARFVFMTGGAFHPEIREFIDRGERPCLDKPFDRRELLETIDQALTAQG